MAKFFKTATNILINIEAIQMICEIKGEALFETQQYGYELSSVGKSIFYWNKIYDKNDLKTMEKFGLKPSIVNSNLLQVLPPTQTINNMIVAYCIHLNAPSGGINNTHEKIYIIPSDYKKLIRNLEIIN